MESHLVVHQIYLADSIDPGDPVFFFLVGARGGRKPRIVPKGAIDATTTEKFPVRVARGAFLVQRATFENKNLQK